MKECGRSRNVLGLMLAIIGALALSTAAGAAKPEIKGKFELLKDELSTHQPGKVKLVEFADFYCPHCHRFDGEGLEILEKEFGKKLDVTMVGYPVIGHLVAHRAGHALHTEFAAKILEETHCWRLVEGVADAAVPVGLTVKASARLAN